MKALLHLCTLACVTLPVLAQQNIVYQGGDFPTLGDRTAFPFGKEGCRLQQLVTGNLLPNQPTRIQDLFLNPNVSGTTPVDVSQVYYGDIEIRMGITQVTQITSDWNFNNPNPTEVYRGPLLVRFERDTWCAIGLPSSYAWVPTSQSDNLIVEFIVHDVIDTGSVPPNPFGLFLELRRGPNTTIRRAFSPDYTSGNPNAPATNLDGDGMKLGLLLDDGNFIAHDGSCPGSSGDVPVIGAAAGSWPVGGMLYDVTLSKAAPFALATLVLSTSSSTYLGIPLPFDMGLLGAPSCTFWHGWEFFAAPILTDGNGDGVTPILFPANAPLGTRIYGTYLCFDAPANPLGLVPSGFATMIF